MERVTRLLREASREISSLQLHSGPNLRDGTKLNEEIEDLTACMTQLTTQLHDITVQRRRTHNSTLPVHRLPLELLCKILSLALRDDPNMVKYGLAPSTKGLHDLASVCHAWFHQIKETPSFWNVASSTDPLPLLRQTLTRSKTSPLDVFHHQSGLDYGDITYEDNFMGLLIPESHRWRSLNAFGNNPSPHFISRLRDLSVPALETLKIQYYDDAGALEIFGGRADRLRHQQLLDILSASPALIELSLAHLSSSDEARILREDPIELSELETLYMSYTPTLSWGILASIRIPACKDITITDDQQPQTTYRLFEDPSLTHISSLFKAFWSSSPSVEVAWFDDGSIKCSTTNSGHQNLRFSGDGTVLPNGLKDALEGTGVREVHLQIHNIKGLDRLLPLLHFKRPVTKVTLCLNPFNESVNSVNVLMEFLSRPVTVDGVTQWPLSRLERLELPGVGSMEPESFLDAISRRYRTVNEGGEDGNGAFTVVEPCAPLHLDIKGARELEAGDVARLRSILGDSNVLYQSEGELPWIEVGS
ncbi:hypothetical protein FRB96_002497 [Tulasnella sp. 330]|nr:hypothetical protein FRB96_002497 [Tulasnella sp. 330]